MVEIGNKFFGKRPVSNAPILPDESENKVLASTFERIPDHEVNYFVRDLRRRCCETLQSGVVSFYFVTMRRAGHSPSEQVVVYPNSKLDEIEAFAIEALDDEDQGLVAYLDGTTVSRRAGYKAEYEEYIKMSKLGGRAGPLVLSWDDREQVNQMVLPYSDKYRHSLNSEAVYLAFWSFSGGSCWSYDVWMRESDFRLLRTSEVKIEHSMQNEGYLREINRGVLGSYEIQVLTTEEIKRRGVYGTGPTQGLTSTRGAGVVK